MHKKVKVTAGSAAALAILISGGLAIAVPAQAAHTHRSVSVVNPADETGTDDVQDEVDDGTNDGDTADDEGVEDTSDDINGLKVEDGTQDEVGGRAGPHRELARSLTP